MRELERVAEELDGAVAGEQVQEAQPAPIEPTASTASGTSITSGLSCARFVVMTIVRRAVEGHEHQPPGIERRERGGSNES